jgi:small subunit ribosomal protein S1
MEITKTSNSEIPSNDEAWWASILSDEEKFATIPEETVQLGEDPSVIRNDWRRASDLFENDQIVNLEVINHNRGGLLVEGDGFCGFVPSSHLLDFPAALNEKDREKFLSAYVGRKINLKIIECFPEEGRIIFSERAAQALPGKRLEIFNSVKSGQVVSGTITNITKFGVFVDLGGVEGLIHISELSWGRVEHPEDICSLGQTVDALVLDVFPERCRIALSMKRLFQNPWEKLASKYTPNMIISAEVTGLVSFGAFARLEEGVDGLIHISEIPIESGECLDDILHTGENIDVRILHIDVIHQKLSLSLILE